MLWKIQNFRNFMQMVFTTPFSKEFVRRLWFWYLVLHIWQGFYWSGADFLCTCSILIVVPLMNAQRSILMRSLELANIFIKSDKAEKSSSIWEKILNSNQREMEKSENWNCITSSNQDCLEKNTKFHRELVIKTSNWIVWNEDQMIQQVFSKRLTKDVLTAKKTLVKLWRLDWQVNSDEKKPVIE